MTDLLAHVLIAYAVFTAASWRYSWLNQSYVTAGMAGAMIPDMMKIALILPGSKVEQVFGIPFDWEAIHTLGGTFLSVLVGVLVVIPDPDTRKRVFICLSFGGASHLFLDALLAKPSGHSYPVFWPVTRYSPPTPGLYLSTDWLPTLIAAIFAGVIYLANYRYS